MQEIKRNKFRNFYQPSKILLGVIPVNSLGKYNLIALCFTMTCSYEPPMIAVSFEKRNLSFDLMQVASNFVLSVPGESLAHETMSCGILSGRDVDKFEACNLATQSLVHSDVPGIRSAIANIELSVESRFITGDHLTVVGRVLGYHVNRDNIEKNLLAIGPNQCGYKLLVRKGIHRIAVVEGDNDNFTDGFDIERVLS